MKVVFDEHFERGLYTLKTRLVNDTVEVFESLRNPELFHWLHFESDSAIIAYGYKRKSQRQLSGTMHTDLLMDVKGEETIALGEKRDSTTKLFNRQRHGIGLSKSCFIQSEFETVLHC